MVTENRERPNHKPSDYLGGPPVTGTSATSQAPDDFEARFPALSWDWDWDWDWESDPHRRDWVDSDGPDPLVQATDESKGVSDSGASALRSDERHLTSAPIQPYPSPPSSRPTPRRASPPRTWEQQLALRLTTPPVPAPPRLTTTLPPSPQTLSSSPEAKQPPTPKRPSIPGTYTSWTPAVSDSHPNPPPPTPAAEDVPPFPCPHLALQPPQVPFSDTCLPTYAQPAPSESTEARVQDLVASFEAMAIDGGATTSNAPSPILQLTTPPAAAPHPMTPNFLPTQASSTISQCASPGLALGSKDSSASPCPVPPSTPLSPLSTNSPSQRSASFPTLSPGRPTILRPASTNPFDSPFPSSPYAGPTPSPPLPPIMPAAVRLNNPSPSLSPWTPAPDSPDLGPVPLPHTWLCSLCTLVNTAASCEVCGKAAPQWCCTRCTLHNDHGAAECEACGDIKSHRPVSQPLSPISLNRPTQVTEGAEGVVLGFGRGHENYTPQPAVSPQTTLTHTWMCPLCTYGNEAGDKCAMCSTLQP